MIVNFVVILSVLLGFCALGFEIGMLELKRLQLQRAADAAALGGAYALERGSSWAYAANADAALNGFTNGVNNVTVSPVYPITSGTFNNNKSAMQATVTQQVTTMFHAGAYTLRAQATALLPPCLYLTSTNTSVATYTVNASAMTINCSAYIGYSTHYQSTNPVVSVYAAYLGGPSSASNITPAPGIYYNYPPQPDPLAYVVSPTFNNSCPPNNNNLNIDNATTILPANTYCGGLTISNSAVTLQPGLYIIAGGLTLNQATLTGAGVTLFLTSSTGVSGYGKFSATHNSVLNLSAPTSTANSGVPGIVIFGDRNWSEASGPSSTSQDFTMNDSTINGDGIIYLTNTGISCVGCTMQGIDYFGIVASNLSETSNSNITLSGNYSYLPGGNPFRPKESLAQ